MPRKAVLVGEKRIIEMRVFVRFWIVIAFVVLLGLFPAHSSEFASIYCKYTSGQTMTADGAEELEIGAAGYDGFDALLTIEKDTDSGKLLIAAGNTHGEAALSLEESSTFSFVGKDGNLGLLRADFYPNRSDLFKALEANLVPLVFYVLSPSLDARVTLLRADCSVRNIFRSQIK